MSATTTTNIDPRYTESPYLPNSGEDDGGWWYYSETAFIIKWVITGLILIAILVFFVGGYFHAKSRMKKGLPLLRYHRWMISRQHRQHYSQGGQVYYHTAPYGHGQPVPLQQYGPPPPAYGENDYVPPYAPPQGASKANPDQTFHTTHVELPGAGPSQPPPIGTFR